MAALRLGVCATKKCRRYNFFFYVAGLVILTQLYIGYSFYRLTQDELNLLKREIQERHLDSESLKKSPNYTAEYDVEEHRNPKFKNMLHNRDITGNEDKHKEELKEKADKYRQQVENRLLGNGMEEQVRGATGRNKTSPLRKAVDVLSKIVDNINTDKKDGRGAKEINLNGFKLPCENMHQDARSAVSRAQTPQCREKLAQISCEHENKYMFAESLPRFCPLKGSNKGEYVGCFEDSYKKRLLGDLKEDFKIENSVTRCINQCLTSGLNYAGLQYGVECWCGAKLDESTRREEDKCDMPCPAGGEEAKCGGYLHASVYHTGAGERASNPAPYVEVLPPDTPAARIVFVFTINGRADRQVRRLFKALYHEHHYYYIHVDSRQEHLFREMSKLADRFPNVRVATRRLSTIWGGSSLLTMLLNCMQDLLGFDDWHWDFFLNLSESDFPLKPLDELVAFLSLHKDKNFLKAHGSNTPKFIKKQGMDQLFWECETHMWRLGRRHVPYDVVWSGGSDWICLNKQFCDYAVNSEDELMTGLKHYFDYALLPAESFFHTALLNSEYCGTHVNNNLHATNWNRKQGCKCQYKHIVDWCGCSPNDYLPRDANKLQLTRTSPVYFARKFEHIISTSIISTVEMMAVPHIDFDKPVRGLQSYWQSEYNHLDVHTKTGDALYTYYQSLARNAVKSLAETCDVTLEKVLETHVYSHAGKIQGLLVLLEATLNGATHEVETLLQRPDTFSRKTTVGASARLQHVDVGSLWDPKEETFRNYGRLLGPHSDIAVALWCGTGEDVTFSVVYLDPADVIAASYDVKVKQDNHVATHSPNFYKPLRPGVWKIHILYAWEMVAETTFHVTPLSHVDQQPIPPSDAPPLHSGPGNLYVDRNFKEFSDVLKLKDSVRLKQEAEANALHTGDSLLQWIDDLSSILYNVAESCFVGQVPAACGSHVSRCEDTKWSSKSPDPKSEIGDIDPSTHMIRR